jgi:hypothetical protein
LNTTSTAVSPDEVTTAVRITHPFHPQCGHEIDFVEQRVQWGEDRVFYRDRAGHLASLPARWTSLMADDALTAGRPAFLVEDLLTLIALIARLRA